MLLPEKLLGLNFVIVFCRKTSSFDYIFIATSQPDTLLLIYHNQSAEPNKVYFPTKGTQNLTSKLASLLRTDHTSDNTLLLKVLWI
ncbi:hypothetical protein BgiBS90_013621, partial [Biomphalaria glabrata]